MSDPRRRQHSCSSRSKKRQGDSENGASGAPPPKKQNVPLTTSQEAKEKKSRSSYKKEMKEIHADVLRVSRIHEKDQFRMILQESSSSPLILATCSYHRGKDIKFGDRIHVDSEVLRKKADSEVVTEVYIEKVLKNMYNGAREGIRRHSIANRPFCIKPRFISELSDESIKKTVVQVRFLDMNLEFYKGCAKCKHRVAPSYSGKETCKHCKDSKEKITDLKYCRMRTVDHTGQLLVTVETKATNKILELFGVDDIRKLEERNKTVFHPMMMEIEKTAEGWECTDVAQVNWEQYQDYLKEKKRRTFRN